MTSCRSFYSTTGGRLFHCLLNGIQSNALNVGICYARNALVCVIDADCILQEDALSKAVKHFQNDEVVAVGGRLLVKREDSSQLEAIQ